jgi:hypothetical protein
LNFFASDYFLSRVEDRPQPALGVALDLANEDGRRTVFRHCRSTSSAIGDRVASIGATMSIL